MAMAERAHAAPAEKSSLSSAGLNGEITCAHGTSVAAPVVTAEVARLIHIHGALTIAEIRELLSAKYSPHFVSPVGPLKSGGSAPPPDAETAFNHRCR